MGEPIRRPLRRRRWLIALGAAALLLAVVRIGVALLLPRLLRSAGEEHGLDLVYRSLDLSLSTGRIEVSGLEAFERAPAADGTKRAPLAAIDSLAADVEITALLAGRLRFSELWIDGLEAALGRRADGSLALGGVPLAPAPGVGPSDPGTARDDAFDLELPFEARDLRVQASRVRWRDETIAPPIETDVTLELAARDLGLPGSEAHAELSLRAPKLVESLVLSARGTSGRTHVDAALELSAHGVDAPALARLLGDGVAASARRLDLAASARVELSGETAGRSLAGEIAVDRLEVRADGEECAVLACTAPVSELTRRSLRLGAVVLDLRARATRRADGAFQLAGLELRPDAAPAGGAAVPRVPAEGESFALQVAELRPSVALALRDESVAPPALLGWKLRDSRVRDLAFGATGSAPALDLRGEAGGVEWRLAGETRLEPGRQPALHVDLELAAECVDVARLRTLLRSYGVEPDLERGELRTRLSLSASVGAPESGPDSLRSARVEITGLAASEPGATSPWLSIGRVVIDAPSLDPDRHAAEIAELTVADARITIPTAGGDGLPVTFSLGAREPFRLGGELESDPAPVVLDVVAQAAPAVGSVVATLELSPFAADPALALDLRASGIAGTKLAESFPDLFEGVDATALADGVLSARLEASLRAARRDPWDFGFLRNFAAEVGLSRLEMRADPDGEVFAGIERVEADIASFRPGSGGVHLSRVEIAKPLARIELTERALGVGPLAFLINEGALSDEGSRSGSEPPPETPAPETPERESGEGQAPANPPRLRLDELRVDGLDVTFTDATREPPLVVPLTDLEARVERVALPPDPEAEPLVFHASLHAGEVELERRAAWEELEASGEVALAAPARGTIRFDARGFELQLLRGLAAAGGVTIGDGVLDTTVDVALAGADGVTIRSDSTLAHLSLSEPPDGPISRWLSLPAPLDTVLFLMRDEDGRQHVPIRLEVPADGVSTAAIAGLTAKTLARLAADAVASAPMRVVSGALDATQITKLPGIDRLPGLSDIPGLADLPVIGELLGGPDGPLEPVVLEFPPGAAVPPAGARERLDALIAAMLEDEKVVVTVVHEIGAADSEPLATLVAPAAAEVRDRGPHGRWRGSRHARDHDRLAREARAELELARAAEAGAKLAELAEIGRELAVAEEALDHLLAAWDDEGDRGSARALREAESALADLRFAEIRALLEREGVPQLQSRLLLKRGRPRPPDDGAAGRIALLARRRP